jgi:hypothetical protein
MASNKLNVSELDFDQIKANLKTFLQGQSEFQDYNFEGSSFAVLLDVLSYNTHYMSYVANMSTNEMFLDSADIRNNIVSLAKMLGYTPTSPRCPRASVDIKVNNATGSSVTMNKGTIFTSIVDGATYQYVNNEDITITPSDGVYNFSDVTLYEGTLVTYKYTNNENDVDQRFVIPNANVDTTTLQVSIQNSTTDTTTKIYTLANGYESLDGTSKVYFVQESGDGKFEVYFGDGVTGKKLADGNIVIMEYVITNKEASNGASTFTLSGTIGGFQDITITTNSNSQGGNEAETNSSIKFNAPLQYASQDRAVTTTDYETLTQSLYPNAQSVSAWGGEDDETPRYGQVKIAIKAASGSTLTEQTKADLVSKLKKFNVASVTPVIVDPEVTSILVTSTVKYDPNKTAKTKETLKAELISTLSNYNETNLQKFDAVFRFSKLSTLFDSTDSSILSNISKIKIRKSFQPVLLTSTKYNIYFRNALYNPHAGHNASAGGILSSTGFKIDGYDQEMFLNDDGMGNVRLFYSSGGQQTYLNETQGTIDYSTGAITINSLNVKEISNIRGAASTVIELTVSPSSNDIVPVRDQIVEVDVANSSITAEADTIVGGGSDAGVGYTTASSY